MLTWRRRNPARTSCIHTLPTKYAIGTSMLYKNTLWALRVVAPTTTGEKIVRPVRLSPCHRIGIGASSSVALSCLAMSRLFICSCARARAQWLHIPRGGREDMDVKTGEANKAAGRGKGAHGPLCGVRP